MCQCVGPLGCVLQETLVRHQIAVPDADRADADTIPAHTVWGASGDRHSSIVDVGGADDSFESWSADLPGQELVSNRVNDQALS